ncbi:MAG: hypothetical protein AAGG54_15185 [Pseudomonadota bacterium]
MKKSFAVMSVVLGLAGGAASAATMTNVTYQTPGNVFGSENYKETLRISSSGSNRTVNAGEFQVIGDNGVGDFSAFCVDLFQNMVSGKDYTEMPGLFSSAIVDELDRLFTSVYAMVDTATEAAAFQVAIWEIITDFNAGYDLDSGDFSMSKDAAVEGLANTFLAGLDTAETGGYTLSFYQSDDSQNLVTATPVPLPASALALLAALGGLFGLRRRARA